MVTVHRAFSGFSVDDLDAAERFYRDTLGLAVNRSPMGLELDVTGVQLERYPGMPQDDDGIVRSTDPSRGPTIAWFRDPARNVLALIEV
ncbi:VOC family protein [Isoptericola variabilis]|uniref:Glyoxalase/bleomycin resistance protein/dioxygenase n=1 Tax=Isoptericola variabilis (strain 225) TaxID=743718 RepID=F6FVG4_ISOV2|nr:glyoxalase/bleomycin resistance protein/dioxygenase [Isoptericola variabilis]AEG44391.1 glyoxalase/bleomycin resistance protein/dioxygenase [Isoptericola variabilis 225]TWH34384.1 hypothetical protein L600_001200000400 [Isoptericola variabilis J7]